MWRDFCGFSRKERRGQRRRERGKQKCRMDKRGKNHRIRERALVYKN
jgi:hypothetical protein